MLNVSKFPLQRTRKEFSEIKLAKASIKGDSKAYTELVKFYKNNLYKIAYSYTKDEQKALDIFQETTYKGLLNIKKFGKVFNGLTKTLSKTITIKGKLISLIFSYLMVIKYPAIRKGINNTFNVLNTKLLYILNVNDKRIRGIKKINPMLLFTLTFLYTPYIAETSMAILKISPDIPM